MIRLILVITALVMLFIGLGVPSASEINACTDSTGWGVERCKMELVR